MKHDASRNARLVLRYPMQMRVHGIDLKDANGRPRRRLPT